MKQQTKLSQKQEHIEEQQSHAQPGKEFADSDELLRFDAGQTTVPPEIAERLKRAAAGCVPATRTGWLKRFFRRSNP